MKTYVKPEVIFESFELSQSVASCGYQMGAGDINSCHVTRDNVEDDYMDMVGNFTGSNGGCTQHNEVYCYTDGSGMPTLFIS